MEVGTTKLDVVLAEDAELLDEVVVVGYGTMKKRMLQVPFHILVKR